MRKSLGLYAILFFSLLPIPSSGMPSACPEHYWRGQAPDLGGNLANTMLTGRVQEICYEGYAVIYSGATETLLPRRSIVLGSTWRSITPAARMIFTLIHIFQGNADQS